MVHRDAIVFAELPQPVVLGVVERPDVLLVGWHARDQHTADEVVLHGEPGVGYRLVDVVQEDLRDAGPTPGNLGAPVGQPAVVGADAGESPGILFRRGRAGDERPGGEERWHGVREDDLADDAVLLQLTDPAFVVPVSGPAVTLKVAERVLVAAAPRVEVLPEVG